MANKPISQLTALTTVADGDLLPIVDVSDTTQSSNGTTKKVTRANLLTSAAISGMSLTSPTLTTPTLTSPVINTGVSGTAIDTDGTLTANSDTKITSQKAVKTYADTKTTLSTVQQDVTTNYGMARQAIMNGNFDVWQRGTSLTLSTVTAYLADRWLCSIGDVSGALTVSRQTFTIGQTTVPCNPKYFLRFAEAGAPGVAPYITQRIEGVEHFANGKATLSVWLSVASGTLVVTPKFVQSFGSGGSPSSDVITTNSTWTVTTTPTKFTTTFNVPSVSGKTIGSTAGSDYCAIKLDFPTGGAFTIDIAQVQLCAGDVALPFQPKSFEEELRACQRYYEKSFDYSVAPADATGSYGGSLSCTVSNTNVYANVGFISYKVRKRIASSPTLYNPSTSSANKIHSTIDGEKPAITSEYGESGARVFVNNSACSINASLFVHWTADAEF